MDGINIEGHGTLARIKTRLHSNTRRLVIQGSCLKIYFALCLCPVVAETSVEEPEAVDPNSNAMGWAGWYRGSPQWHRSSTATKTCGSS